LISIYLHIKSTFSLNNPFSVYIWEISENNYWFGILLIGPTSEPCIFPSAKLNRSRIDGGNSLSGIGLNPKVR
jgi:hypothetical protein